MLVFVFVQFWMTPVEPCKVALRFFSLQVATYITRFNTYRPANLWIVPWSCTPSQ